MMFVKTPEPKPRKRFFANHRMGNTAEFDKRWRWNRHRNKIAAASRRKNRR